MDLAKSIMKVQNEVPASETARISDTVQRESLAGGKFGEIGKFGMIHQTKTIQISIYN